MVSHDGWFSCYDKDDYRMGVAVTVGVGVMVGVGVGTAPIAGLQDHSTTGWMAGGMSPGTALQVPGDS